MLRSVKKVVQTLENPHLALMTQPSSMNRFKYFIQGVKDLKTKGTIAPTSKYTSKQMLRNINFSKSNLLVELGAGDGSITRRILEQMKPEAKLYSFEIDPKFCGFLERIEDPRLHVINDSAEHLSDYLQQWGVDKVDSFISGIPFVVLPDALGNNILQQAKNALHSDGCFVQFHYSTIPKKRYEQIFDSVAIKLEVRNLPPAFVFTCH